MAQSVQVAGRQFHLLRGNLHVHTNESDGTLSHRQVAGVAAGAGLDFVVVTDHNVFRQDVEGWAGRVLLLVGEEVHDPQREPQSSHTLCLNIQEDVAQLASDPQRVIDAVAAQGGLSFLAHPFERDVAPFLPEPNISWRDWGVTGYDGLEIWNYMSEFKAVLRSKLRAILYAFFPSLAISGPYPETLLKWDELLRMRSMPVLGGSDAHGTVYRMGPISRPVQSYQVLFRSINTYLLAAEPLNGNLKHDKTTIYDALKAGRSYVGYEQAGPVADFSFWARSGGRTAVMGETLELDRALELRVEAPAHALLRLVHDGRVIAQTRGRELALMTPKPGVYRAEAYRTHRGGRRGWIFSNPIYVR